ncbi:MAG: threonylcarbamoyl-AMP synthase [Fimbriimonadaceae bacterium]|nr:threonylcarbamoyl-AMP synthase [Fimbriimonadaceae bacterium]
MSILPPTEENIHLAGDAIRAGKLVVIPTETVYGLAADATNRRAVESIFRAKGRPQDNPLIVHIGESKWLEDLAVDVPEYAQRLAGEFWPGPLTLVLTKLPHVLDEVTAGLDSVAVRMPSHEIALRVIREANVPIAAPSANKFMAVSPTRIEHIDPEIELGAEMILDGGPCGYGVESTVIECLGDHPRLLRPGGLSRAKIEEFLSAPLVAADHSERRSPGRYPKHYAPRTPVRLVSRLGERDAGITFQVPQHRNQLQLSGSNPDEFAANLYHALHVLDERSVSEILIETPPETPEWEVIWDRLRKASSS